MSNQPMSPKGKFDVTDAANLGKNALLVGAAAALTYVGQNLSGIDFGNMSALVIPVVTVVIDFFVKWAKNNTKAE